MRFVCDYSLVPGCNATATLPCCLRGSISHFPLGYRLSGVCTQKHDSASLLFIHEKLVTRPCLPRKSCHQVGAEAALTGLERYSTLVCRAVIAHPQSMYVIGQFVNPLANGSLFIHGHTGQPIHKQR